MTGHYGMDTFIVRVFCIAFLLCATSGDAASWFSRSSRNTPTTSDPPKPICSDTFQIGTSKHVICICVTVTSEGDASNLKVKWGKNGTRGELLHLQEEEKMRIHQFPSGTGFFRFTEEANELEQVVDYPIFLSSILHLSCSM